MQRTIVSIGMEVPSDDVTYIPFDSDQSLLDADIVLYEPTLGPRTFLDAFVFLGIPRQAFPIRVELVFGQGTRGPLEI